VQDKLLSILGDDQIDAGPLVFSMEKQMRVRDDDRVRRNVCGVNCLDVDVTI
jgi:hypothetical protein